VKATVTKDFARGGGGGGGEGGGPVHITGTAQTGPNLGIATSVAHHSEVGSALAGIHYNIKKWGQPEHHIHIHHEDTGKVHQVKLNAKGYHSASYPVGHYGEHHPPPAATDSSGQWR
jgi:hypothetical protein